MRFLYFFFFFILSVGHLNSQVFQKAKFSTITQRDGLLSNTVWNTGEDKYGRLWVSCLGGLSCYDGYRFKNYKYDPTDSLSPPDEEFVAFLNDSKGNFWVRGKDGFARYNYTTDQFEYPFGRENPQLKESFHFVSNKNSNLIWFTNAEGLHNIDIDAMKINYKVLPLANIFDHFIDEKENIWISSLQTQLYQYNISTQKLTQYDIPISGLRFFNGPGSEIWFTYPSGISKINTENPAALQTFQIPKLKNAHKLLQARSLKFIPNIGADSLLWLCLDKVGIYLFNTKKFTWAHLLQPDDKNPNSLPTKSIGSLYVGKNNFLWVGSFYSGLIKIDFNEQQFDQELLPLEYHNYSSYSLWNQQPNSYLLGTFGQGLFSFDKAKKIISKRFEGNKNLIYSNDIIWIKQFEKDRFLFGTENGVYQFHNGSYEQIPLPEIKNKANTYSSACIPSLSPDSIYVLTGEGPYKISKTTCRGHLIRLDITNKTNLERLVRDVEEDMNGNLWIATAKGLYVINPRTRSLKKIEPLIPDYRFNYLVDIQYDGKNTIYVANNLGVYEVIVSEQRFNEKRVDFYKEIKNLVQIESDQNKNIWFFCSSSIYRLHVEKNVLNKMNAVEGFISDAFTTVNKPIVSDGIHFISFRENKLTKFNPLLIFNDTQDVPLYVNHLFVNNQRVPISPISVSNKQIDLNYDRNNLEFDLATFNFIQEDQINIRYKIEGYHDNWIQTHNVRNLVFQKMPPGSYVFKATASKGEGNYNNTITQIPFVIHPPWWATWWFRLLAILGVGGTIYALFHSLVKKIRYEAEVIQKEAGYKQREAELQKEIAQFSQQIAEVELNALKAQMNPHFVFNCLNSINTYIILNDPQSASNYLSKFSKLIRKVLDASRSELIPLKDELETLQYYIDLEKMRYSDKFTVEYHTDFRLDMDNIEIPPMMIQPFVENAIWHGLMHKEASDGKLFVGFYFVEPNRVRFVIEDNGVGREKSSEINHMKRVKTHKSHAMNVTDERIAIMAERYQIKIDKTILDLKDSVGKPLGTRVILEMDLIN